MGKASCVLDFNASGG